MYPAKLEMYRERLRELAADVRENVSDVTEQARQPTGGQADGGLSNAPMHLGDLGTEAYLQELNSTLLETEQELSNEIYAALHRIDAGTFGACEECGQPIESDRLEALPYTRYCLNCAELAASAPAANLNVGRPRGPQDTLASTASQGVEQINESEMAGLPAERLLPDSAAGSAAGGTAIGGLAGTNSGGGDPEDVDLGRATGNGRFNPEPEGAHTRYSGPSGGAVGGAAGARGA